MHSLPSSGSMIFNAAIRSGAATIVMTARS